MLRRRAPFEMGQMVFFAFFFSLPITAFADPLAWDLGEWRPGGECKAQVSCLTVTLTMFPYWIHN